MTRRLDATRAHRSRARFDRLPSSPREQAIVKATPAEEPFTKIVSGVSPELMQRLAQNQLVPKERLTDLGVGNVAPSSPGPLTVADVEACQANWANAIQTISKTYLEKGDYIQAAADAAGELYGYGHSKVLFKPTKAAEEPFRPTGEMAMSYFVGSKAVENGIPEDGGFAINGGKGWASCVYDNHQIELKGGIGLAMGNYYFTCATSGGETKVEYTFGYGRCDDGKVRIFLHHSSVPFAG